jgi:hypothetical protein
MTRISTIKLAMADLIKDGKKRLGYFSFGRAVLGLAIGIALIAGLFSFSSLVTAAVSRVTHRKPIPLASPTPAPLPKECEIPDGFIKLSKCSGKPADAVIVGVSSAKITGVA